MKPPIEVMLDESEACAHKLMGLDAFEYLALRFKEDHGLIFTPEQLAKGEGFTYEESTDSKAFRVRYVGGVL